DGVAALVTEIRRVGVVSSAFAAEHLAGMKRIRDNGEPAVLTRGAQVVQTLQVAALALPVADGVIHEFQLGDFAEVGDGKHGLKYRLQSGVVALTRQAVHLQKAVIRTLLHLDEVGNLNGGWNFGKIEA